MGLKIIGLGLNPPSTITMAGIEAVRAADKVFLELYTNSIQPEIGALEKALGTSLSVITREELEESTLLEEEAQKQEVVLLISGDPLFATTHYELVLSMENAGIPVEVLHNASVIDAVLATGLQGYKFGRIISLPWPERKLPKSPYVFIQKNKSIGLHTLVLLDVARDGKPAMSVAEGVKLLLAMESELKQHVLSSNERWVGCAALGSSKARIRYAQAPKLKLSGFPQCIIIPGKLHFLEEEALERFK